MESFTLLMDIVWNFQNLGSNMVQKYVLYIGLIFIHFCSYQNVENPSKNESQDIYAILESLSTSISEKLEIDKIQTLAIMDYTNLNEKNSQMGAYISDEITLQLFLKEKFQIIEREQIDYIIEEQKLNASGLINEASAIEIGNILSVDAIILGNISDINNNIIINTKIVSSLTGEIIFIDKTLISKTNEFYITTNNNQDTEKTSDLDTFSSTSKNYKKSLKRLSKNLMNCLENNNYTCYSKFTPSKDQLRKIILIKYRENKLDRTKKIKNLNIELKKYLKKSKQNFSHISNHLKKRKINWRDLKIEKMSFKIIKDYDQKKIFSVDLILNDQKKYFHIFYKAFMLNGKWIINDIEIKRK